MFGPNNQRYYIKLLFLLDSLVDDSSTAVSQIACEMNNSVTNIMNKINRINLVNSAMQSSYITCRIQRVNPGSLQTNQTDFHDIKFYRAIHCKADNVQTLCAMDPVHL